MIKINEDYSKLQASYLFSNIAKKVTDFQNENPDKEIIKLGIGDVTKPLPEACIAVFHQGVDEMSKDETFKGYGPEQGYEFLRKAIAENDFQSRGTDIQPDEIFISDGAKCDSGNIQEIFSTEITVAIPDPVYPVYIDTNVMAGRRTGDWRKGSYSGVVYLDFTEENGFVPPVPEEPMDLVSLCFPNNPTGATASKSQLASWVEYARANNALLLFDAAYESFIRDPELPRTIYEIDGAREVSIEMRSFSKTAGFTGTRCAFTVVPKECRAYTSSGEQVAVRDLWNRRHTTKFNGVSYPIQKAAAAVYSSEGKNQIRALQDYYLDNARLIVEKMEALGYTCMGGKNSPYIWIKTGMDSWEFFDLLLTKAGVVCTPGSGFGSCGEGYIRISAFNHHENVVQAMALIGKILS